MGIVWFVVLLAAVMVAIRDRLVQQRLSAKHVERIDYFYAWLSRRRLMQERREMWLAGQRWY